MNDECPALDVTSSKPLTIYEALPHEAFPKLCWDSQWGFVLRLEVDPTQTIEIHMSELQLLSLAGQITRLAR